MVLRYDAAVVVVGQDVSHRVVAQTYNAELSAIGDHVAHGRILPGCAVEALVRAVCAAEQNLGRKLAGDEREGQLLANFCIADFADEAVAGFFARVVQNGVVNESRLCGGDEYRIVCRDEYFAVFNIYKSRDAPLVLFGDREQEASESLAVFLPALRAVMLGYAVALLGYCKLRALEEYKVPAPSMRCSRS